MALYFFKMKNNHNSVSISDLREGEVGLESSPRDSISIDPVEFTGGVPRDPTLVETAQAVGTGGSEGVGISTSPVSGVGISPSTVRGVGVLASAVPLPLEGDG